MATRTIKLKEYEQFKKMVALIFSSDQPGEVMAAIGKVKAIFKRNEVDWDMVFGKLISVESVEDYDEGEPPPKPQHRQATRASEDDINDAFNTVMSTMNHGSGFADFMHSIHEQWQNKGRLSPDQLSALFRARDRANERGRYGAR